MKSHWDHLIRSAIDWAFRKRDPGVRLIRYGLWALVGVVAGTVLSISVPTPYGDISLSVMRNGSGSTFFVWLLAGVAVGCMVVGAVWLIRDQKRVGRKKVVVIEGRGLRDLGGWALADAVPDAVEGHRQQIHSDIRESVEDGVIRHPAAAFPKLVSLPVQVKQAIDGLNRDDITLVYGGLVPVPFAFLTGVLLDDEELFVFMDWDRNERAWRTLDDADDGARFHVGEMACVPRGTESVALSVSVSYQVDVVGVREKVGEMPLVELTLESGSVDCHWSEEKQRALGRQFFEAIRVLANLGVRHVHLFLAAQNSVVFRFGGLYDKRNFPRVVVYQYERDEVPPYPWGIGMPVAGASEPTVVKDV